MTNVTEDWRDSAACRTADPGDFFPVGSGAAAAQQAATAKAVCAGCGAREQRLAWALSSGQSDGVLGGLTARERTMLKRKLARGASEAVPAVAGGDS